MIGISLFLVLFIVNLFSLEKEKLFILTFPGSGTMWTIYCLDKLNKQNEEKFSIVHDHYHPNFQFRKADKQRDRLLFVVRNYKECFLRYKEVWKRGFRLASTRDLDGLNTNPHHYLSDYFDNFVYYESWNPSRRLLIYYEDLMNEFESSMKEISEFLSVDESWLELFMESYEAHKEKSIAFYENAEHLGHCESKGNNIFFHSEKCSYQDRVKIDLFVSKFFPEVYRAYLTQYAEP